MLDFFAILTKGGIVLWSSRSTNQVFTHPVNSLIRNNILQERAGAQSFDCDAVRLHYKLDNELDLIYIVAYQKILQLTYIDKFMGDVQTEFREKCKPQLPLCGGMDFDFASEYQQILAEAENWARLQLQEPKQMRSYVESQKSKKTVGSMFEPKNKETESTSGKTVKIDVKPSIPEPTGTGTGVDLIAISRQKLKDQINVKKKPEAKKTSTKPANAKSSKKPRVWDLNENSRYMPELDWSKDKSNEASSGIPLDSEIVGSMQGVIKDLENESDEELSPDEVEDISPSDSERTKTTSTGKQAGLFSLFKGLVGSKNLKRSDIEQSLEKFQDHLIGKNVAADIAHQLCESVAAQLEGRVLGTFESIASIVKATLTDSLVKILSPKRRVDILRDCYEAKKEGRPYVMCFCGVNGVGKSTNLSKICFWLIENNYNVLIAACDTFRAGAIEQLRTHTRHLNTLHPPEKHEGRTMVQLYERGYGKDAAGIAMEAIRFAKDTEIDVVLIDTAGRMQDNEPLMRALAKLIQVNDPDLVLFVGEALVGNEAVDQLVKFNQSLSDFSSSQNAHIIDGIVLTKFDTIDDKVGAAISMTYITGQPIVFVGTGQSYSDLKALNAKSVVHALLK